MTVKAFGASLAAMVLVSTLSVGCSNKAELAANRVRKFALILTHSRPRGASGAWTSPIALV